MVYVDEWTAAFADTLHALMQNLPGAVAFVAVERRINFTLEDLAPASPAYRFFDQVCLSDDARFSVTRVDTSLASISHSFAYERTEHLELWAFALPVP